MSLIIKENYSLKDLNTFGVEAKARFFVEVVSDSEAMEALGYAHTNNLPIFILGGGSNVLISDDGFNGLVIHNKIMGISFRDQGVVEIGAGENWDDVVKAVIEKNLAGIECLSGVPGSAGGAVVQNIGAYSQTLGDVVSEVYTVDSAKGQEKVFSQSECGFEYRNSTFKKNPGKYVITKFVLKLSPGNPTVVYPDVQKYFEGNNSPSLSEVRNAIIEIRASKGMVIMPQYEIYKSVGSYFVNPIVDRQTFEKLQKSIIDSESRPWFWPSGDRVKVSAAKLISLSGFEKGYRDGNVGISPKQPLAVINLGNAKAVEIKNFASKIKQAVREKFGVELEEEVLYIGNFNK